MSAPHLSVDDLRRELGDLRDRHPKFADDELFVLFFLIASIAEDEQAAVSAICGGPRDKSVDAVLIDDSARIVFVVQGKYRQKLSKKNEHRADVIGFAQTAAAITGDNTGFESLAKNLAPEVLQRLQDARTRVRKRGYKLHLYYVTLGKCSANHRDEAARVARRAGAVFQVFDGKGVLLQLSDYLDGVAPPVPSLDLEIESGNAVRTTVPFNRFDTRTGIESFVFSMTDTAIAAIFERANTRLFARNVRGFLGSTEINEGMEATLEKEPEYFWYYNNGITIVCDEATIEPVQGRHVLRVTNPQIINGQQTTRTLARLTKKGGRASVLVRVIKIPRSASHDGNSFEKLVTNIVSATNWQNHIFASDLVSNDRRQIQIEREFRKLQYQYLRKRMTKGEARRAAGTRNLELIKKDVLAQAVAACDLDPFIVRQGKENLFEERWYDQVFPNADPNYYLPRYWLMRLVGYEARGYPERAYAKWVVLHFAWQAMAPLIHQRARAEAFRHACERDAPAIVPPLLRALDAVFVGVLRFYRANRGVGPRAKDVSSFFKAPARHKEFERFWHGSRNHSRPAFKKALDGFAKALAQAANT